MSTTPEDSGKDPSSRRGARGFNPRMVRGSNGKRRLSRVVLPVLLSFAFFIYSSSKGIATFWTDYLWFNSLGYSNVWSSVLVTKITLTVIFVSIAFVVCWINLYVADKLRPEELPSSPVNDELVEKFRELPKRRAFIIRTATALFVGLFVAAGVSNQWQNWILYRNGGTFGTKDPQFKKDVGFYIFKLPFLNFISAWVFITLGVVTLVVIGWHYFNGGIRSAAAAANGPRISRQVKMHVSLLVGLIALARAVQYYLQRYGLLYSTRGEITGGANYTDIKFQLPAYDLLIVISVVAFALLVANVVRRGWALPAVAMSLWLLVSIVLGGVFPAAVQTLKVKSAGINLEAPYVQRNIDATRAAFGLADIQQPSVSKVAPVIYGEGSNGEMTAAQVAESSTSVDAAPVWDPDWTKATFDRFQGPGIKQYLKLTDLVVDRYPIGEDRKPAPTLIGVREMDWASLDRSAQTWTNEHLVYTHAYGVAFATSNNVSPAGLPNFSLGDIPLKPDAQISPQRFKVYYGQDTEGYVVANNKLGEIDYLASTDVNNIATSATNSYSGTGVKIDSPWRRLAYAIRFGDRNLFFTSNFNESSEILSVRKVRDRLKAVAPFLSFDSTPTPVISESGITWVLDAYTTSDHFPYAQRIGSQQWNQLPRNSDLRSPNNYIRNSVKATVDAATGEVKLYVVDDSDPIIGAYQKAFPGMFEMSSQIPEVVKEHSRYPGDIFTLQSAMFGRYHVTDAEQFSKGNQFSWDVIQASPSGKPDGGKTLNNFTDPATGLTTKEAVRQAPQFQYLELPGDDQAHFYTTRLFGPPQSTNASGSSNSATLTSMMAVNGELGENYGKFKVLEFRPSTPLNDVSNVSGAMMADERVSNYITPLNQQGSQVILSEVNVLPIGDSLAYWRSLMVQSGDAPPRMSQVIVKANNNYRMDATIATALANAINDPPNTKDARPIPLAANLGQIPTTPTSTPSSSSSTSSVPGGPTSTIAGQQLSAEDRKKIADALENAQRQLDEARKLLGG